MTSPTRGRSTARLSLLASGRPLFTSGETGSPSAPLDRRTLEDAAVSQSEAAQLSECTFRAGVDENGRPMGGSFSVEYVWKLD